MLCDEKENVNLIRRRAEIASNFCLHHFATNFILDSRTINNQYLNVALSSLSNDPLWSKNNC